MDSSQEQGKVSQTALRPDFNGFASLQDTKLEKKEVKEIDPEDAALNAIAHTGGWKLVNDYIDTLIAELDETVTTLMAQKASFEEIGQKASVAAVVKAYMERIKSKVSDAADASDLTEVPD